MADSKYDAILVVSFGGPECLDDVLPFLENVLRGKNVPRERMLEVCEHYKQFNGRSPINEQNRQLIAALKTELNAHKIELPVYLGNRNWHPLLPDTLRQMQADGVQNAIAFFTSIYSCYSGCRQYRENIADAQAGLGSAAPGVQKIRMSFNHPLYIEASVDRVKSALATIPVELQLQTRIVFTAHSIPRTMADNCNYETQLKESCQLICDQIGEKPWSLVYQSRSGPPTQPWLEPDVGDFLRELKQAHMAPGVPSVVIMPVGFVSDHMEVLFDLDTEAKTLCDEIGIHMVRAKTVGVHPKFVSMIRELIQERTTGAERRALGRMPPNWDVCPADCCTYARSTRGG